MVVLRWSEPEAMGRGVARTSINKDCISCRFVDVRQDHRFFSSCHGDAEEGGLDDVYVV
jgi:hypothetical protein